MNSSYDLIVQVELLPFADIGQRQPAEIIDRDKALLRHPPKQTVLHVLNDAIAVMHRRSTHLDGAATEQDKLRSVAPTPDATDTGERKSARWVRLYLLDHVERYWFHRRPAIAAMRTLAIDVRARLQCIQINTCN